MAGKYGTLAAQSDYLKDVESFGTGQSITTTEQARAERVADAFIDARFRLFNQDGWDATDSGTPPPLINEIALLIGASILQRMRNVAANFDYAEEDSLAHRLWRQAMLLVEEIERAGVIVAADGTEYGLVAGSGRMGMAVNRSTADAIFNDYTLRSFFDAIEWQNNWIRSMEPYCTPGWPASYPN